MNDESTLLQQHWLLRNACVDPNLSSAAKAVLAVILDHYSRRERTAYPGFDRIARIAGIHRATVMRSVDALEAAGYLEVTRWERRANRYSVPRWPASRDWPGQSGSTSATRSQEATGSTDATIEQAEDPSTGSTDATQLVAPMPPTGSTAATQLVAPMRPEPALEPSIEPAVEHSRVRDLENKRAWIRQRFRLGDLTKEEAAREMQALC